MHLAPPVVGRQRKQHLKHQVGKERAVLAAREAENPGKGVGRQILLAEFGVDRCYGPIKRGIKRGGRRGPSVVRESAPASGRQARLASSPARRPLPGGGPGVSRQRTVCAAVKAKLS